MTDVLGWLFPSWGDVVAFGWWVLLAAGLGWGLRRQRAAEREQRRARYPLANRYQRDGWRP